MSHNFYHNFDMINWSRKFSRFILKLWVPRMDRSSGQGFLPCSLLQGIFWSPASIWSLVVHYSLNFTVYKIASRRIFLRYETPKDALYNTTRQKLLIQRSVRGVTHKVIVHYLRTHWQLFISPASCLLTSSTSSVAS